MHGTLDNDGEHGIESAEVVLPCTELDATLSFFTQRLGFRLDSIFPADAPSVAVLTGHGLRIRLQNGIAGAAGLLRLHCRQPAAVAGGELALTAPNGTRIELVDSATPLLVPPGHESFVVSTMGVDAQFAEGRAGMGYRDLIPDRLGGRFIASHIQIPEGGPVPDYVHFHRVRFQMIYCFKGWVRVVYEDQGPPLVMHAGDCVLQPPRIRHRVLECSSGMEVIEIGCPALHETHVDHDLDLPTSTVRQDREFDGQRFVHHEAAAAAWNSWRLDGFEARDIGIGQATKGLVEVHVARRSAEIPPRVSSHDDEFRFDFVLNGTMTLHAEGHDPKPLSAGDAFVVPAMTRHALAECSEDFELLEVTVPAKTETDLFRDRG